MTSLDNASCWTNGHGGSNNLFLVRCDVIYSITGYWDGIAQSKVVSYSGIATHYDTNLGMGIQLLYSSFDFTTV